METAKNVTRKLAILIALALVFTTVFSNSYVAKAADDDDEEEVTSSTPTNSNIWFYTKDADDDPYLEQKTLLQASNDWTISSI